MKGRVRARYSRQLALFERRPRPGGVVALLLCIQLAALAVAGSVLGVLVRDVTSKEHLVQFDLPTTRFLVEHREAWLTSLLLIISKLGSTIVLVPLVAVAGVLAYPRVRSWRPLWVLVAALAGAVALYDTVKVFVGRPRPRVGALVTTASGYSFPSGHVTQSVAVYGTLILLANPLMRSSSCRMLAWAGTTLLVALIAFSRVYLGVHWTSDVLGGFALGTAWLAMVVAATDAVGRPPLRAPASKRHGPADGTDG